MKQFFLLIFALVAFFSSGAQHNKIEIGERFSVENDAISLSFNRNESGLELVKTQNKITQEELSFVSFEGLKMGNLTQQATNVEWIKKTDNSHEILIHYPDLLVKVKVRLYQSVPVFAYDYAIMNKQKQPLEFDTKNTQLVSFGLPMGGAKGESIEFFDQTDHTNQLVVEDKFTIDADNLKRKGNLIKWYNPDSKKGIFVLKEAPTAIAHLYYPGHDFNIGPNNLSVVGIGVNKDDLTTSNWVNTYSFMCGFVGGDEFTWLNDLRAYQKASRFYNSEIDDMIMMNTWGDRNRDARVSEEFILSELKYAAELGITHYQIDDGWQQGLSKNSASPTGNVWDLWKKEEWLPHAKRFPNGLLPIVEEAKKQNIELGLWFHPSNHNAYENWKQDAEIVVNLFKKYGIKYFKIDGVKLKDKTSETNLIAFFDRIKEETNGQVYFNLDATADQRVGYHFCYTYGNIFLENRYTDWGTYFPHKTLRNLWMLSKYVPAEKLQIEFLNKWRNANKYKENDELAPSKVPFDYQLAITLAAQPLAWFEASGLNKNDIDVLSPLIKSYKLVWNDFHQGTILPIGEEPNGSTWTGFQSMSMNQKSGYLLIFRENTKENLGRLKTYLPPGSTVKLTYVLGDKLNDETIEVDKDGIIQTQLDDEFSFAFYKYEL